MMMEGLQAVKGVRCLGQDWAKPRTGIVSFVMEGADPSEIGIYSGSAL